MAEYQGISESNNIMTFSEIISEKLGFPPLSFSSFEDALTFLYNQAKSKELIVVID